MEEFGEWAEGRIAAYISKKSRHQRIQAQVVTLGQADPDELAYRHGFASGTLVRGNAVFVRLSSDVTWTPSTWPRTFVELEKLVREQTSNRHSIVRWLEEHGWAEDNVENRQATGPDKVIIGLKPLLVVVCHGNELYGYQVTQPAVSLVTAPHAAPLKVIRIDPAWALTRDHATATFKCRQTKRVLVLGAGSLGSPVVDVLARSGVGSIDLVDFETLAPPNVSRHLLGMSSILQAKASAIATRLRKDIPGLQIRGFAEDARNWCAKNCLPSTYDLVVDLTAESSVRIFLAHTRKALLGTTALVHAWVEPYCAATHVVATTLDMPWPASDPAGAQVNAVDFAGAQVRVNLPACSDGFHPYGSADIVQAAGFTAERIVGILDHGLATSTVWSSVRSKAFLDSLELPFNVRRIVPCEGGLHDGKMLTRSLEEVLRDE